MQHQKQDYADLGNDGSSVGGGVGCAVAPDANSFLPPTPGKEADAANFVVPSNWDALTTATGMTPDGHDGMFSQMLDMQMGWDGMVGGAGPLNDVHDP